MMLLMLTPWSSTQLDMAFNTCPTENVMQYLKGFTYNFILMENVHYMGSSIIILVLVTNPGPAVEVCSCHCQSVDPRCRTPLLCSVYWLSLATPKPRPFLRPLHPWNVAASSARPTAGTGEAERKGARGENKERWSD